MLYGRALVASIRQAKRLGRGGIRSARRLAVRRVRNRKHRNVAIAYRSSLARYRPWWWCLVVGTPAEISPFSTHGGGHSRDGRVLAEKHCSRKNEQMNRACGGVGLGLAPQRKPQARDWLESSQLAGDPASDRDHIQPCQGGGETRASAPDGTASKAIVGSAGATGAGGLVGDGHRRRGDRLENGR